MADKAIKLNSFKKESELRRLSDRFETIAVSPIGDPEFTPKPFIYDQVKIVVDDLTTPTARRLYFYSFELQDWLYVALST